MEYSLRLHVFLFFACYSTKKKKKKDVFIRKLLVEPVSNLIFKSFTDFRMPSSKWHGYFPVSWYENAGGEYIFGGYFHHTLLYRHCRTVSFPDMFTASSKHANNLKLNR